MASFDVVSKVDWQEVDNALNQARKELVQRYDFKGSNTSIEIKDGVLTLESADEFKVKAALEVLEGRLAKRHVPLAALERGTIEPASGGRARQTVKVRTGIEEQTARAIVKLVKGTKLKVQAAVQGDVVRISGKKRDDLQSIIASIKEATLNQPLQFENYRE